MSRLALDSTFAHEAEDLLTRIEDGALALESSRPDVEQVNALFRAFHTLKGSSAMVGLTEVASFTHHVETALDRVRDGSLAITPELIAIVLRARDHIQELLACAVRGTQGDDTQGQALIAKLAALRPSSEGAALAERTIPRMRTTYDVYFQLRSDPAAIGLDPQDVIAELAALGTTTAREVAPASEGFSAAHEVTLTSERDENAIRDVFIFAAEGSILRIERGLSEFVTEPPPAPVPLVVEKPAQAPVAAPLPPAASGAAARAQETVRVSSERLDQLMKLVGELVINQARLQQAHATVRAPELVAPVEAMERLIDALRESVFSVRMMPIGPTFARFKRLARDLSTQLDKEIELVTEGDETELDKTVLEQLGDPLVHVLRNSMDHGIEPPAERTLRGKPARGRVTLRAEQEGGNVLITVRDDGRGLDKDKILKKAVEKGLVAASAQLSEREIFQLIMLPGFSTASAVTQLSGRGVGMDVVKRTIESLRGTLEIESVHGQGTTMQLSLPLTLAIIEGLVVQVADDPYIVPMSAVSESVELTRDERRAHNGRNAVALRGTLVPYLRLRELFGCPPADPELEMVVIVTIGGQRVGLVVDRVLGFHQTVVQPLGPPCRDIAMFSGTTSMGDGRVVLIVDLAGLLRDAEQRHLSVRSRADGAHLPSKEVSHHARYHQS